MIGDIRYAFRVLWKSPAFTLVAVIALALGIGANTAIFSVVNTVLIRPLPYRDPDHLVRLFETEPQLPLAPLSGADFLDWREQNHSFSAMALYGTRNATLTGLDQPSRLLTGTVSPQLFSILAATPAIGRDFHADEEQKGRDNVVILSHGFWEQHFASDRGVLGRNLMLDGQPYSIIGVMPAGFLPVPDAAVWTPLNTDDLKPTRGSHSWQVLARLKPGVTVKQGEAELQGIAKHLAETYPQQNEGIGARAIPMLEQRVGNIRPVLLALLGAVAFVLLIACANVANLLLARASVRQREMAVRAAMGASRWRLTRQLLTESVMLGVAGGLAGLLLAFWGVNILRTAAGANLPRAKELSVDGTVLGFTFLVSVITGILFGLAPALQRADLNHALKEGTRGSTSMAGKHLRSALVVAELALSLVLLAGSGLMVKSFMRLVSLDLGFDTSRVLTMNVSPRYDSSAKRESFYHELIDRIRAIPGVEAVAASSKLPLLGGNNGTVVIEGQPKPANNWEGPLVEFSTITPDYFRAMGIPLKLGRACTTQDEAKGAYVAIINETMAKRFWPGENALHKGVISGPNRIDVIGIAGDVRQHGLEREPLPEMYYCYGEQANRNTMALVIRGAGDPKSLIPGVRGAVQSIDKELPVYDVRTMDEVFSTTADGRRFQMLLFGIFAGVALALAAVGIYGVMSYVVSQRSHEIGIRMALGARTMDVLRLIVSQGMRLVGIGVAIGIAASLMLGQSLAGLLYGVRPGDPATLGAVSALLALVALLANCFPAMRASRVDPVIALRHE